MISYFGYSFILLLIHIASMKSRIIKGELAISESIYSNENPEHVKAISKVVIELNHGLYQTKPSISGQFAFYNIPDGHYLLTVSSTIFQFESYFVNIEGEDLTLWKQSWENGERIKKRILNIDKQKGIIVNAPVGVNYFEVRQPWTIMSLVKNQYTFMLGLPLLMYFLMKKMPSYDELQQMQQDQQQGQQPQPQQHQHSH